ncbi:hypothetical protein, partial [Aeribacillus composti]|nr:hypothetical protein [Aeribacillus composti]
MAMRLQPYMIYVLYNHDAPLFTDKTLPIMEVQLGEKVNYDYERNYWYTFNYFRGYVIDADGKVTKKIFQVGITLEGEEAEGIDVYFESTDGKNKRKLYYDKESKVWFELSRFSRQKNKRGEYCYDKDGWIAGIVHAGNIKIVVERDGKVELEERLAFLPSGIPIEDYEIMVSDLFRIREDLVRKNKMNVSVNIKSMRTPERLQKIVKELEVPIGAISASPAGELSFRWEKRKGSDGGKIHLRTELERELNPGKNKYRTFVTYENKAIYENKIIKQELQRLKEYCRFYKSTSLLARADQNQKLNELRSIYEKSSSNVKRLMMASGSLGEFKLNDYQNTIEQMKKEIDELVNERQQLKENQISRLKQLQSIVDNHVQTIPVAIVCSVHSGKYPKDYILNQNQLITIFSSGWDFERNRAHLEIRGYKYIWRNKHFFPNINPYSCKIENKSNSLRDHWKIWKALHYAIQELEDGLKSQVQVEIRGWAKIPRPPTLIEQDIFGQE